MTRHRHRRPLRNTPRAPGIVPGKPIPCAFALAAACFLQAVLGAAAGPVAWWSFDAEDGRDAVSARLDVIEGHHGFADGVHGRALRSDEFETVLRRAAAAAPRFPEGAFTVEAWIAPRAFPWNTCPILMQCDESSGWYLGLDYQGRLQLRTSGGGGWTSCESRAALPGLDESLRFAGEAGKGPGRVAHFGEARPAPSVPLLRWTHVAGTRDREGRLCVYLNGRPAGESRNAGAFAPADAPLQMVRTAGPVLPLFLARPAANTGHPASFDGLIDEVKIHDRALSAGEIEAAFRSVSPAEVQPLQFRRLPTTQDQPGAFGAFYARLAYDEDWDRTRRFGDAPDIFVRFDSTPCTFVCWNGTVYPVFYTEGGQAGQQFEAFETWDRHGCHEAMMDRQSRHSSWRILENTPARVVLHWRHALVAQNGSFINTDPATGWSDWVDDYYTLYPDAVCARRTVLWSSRPAGNHSYAQDNSVMQPGLMPWDIYEEEPMTVANLAGQESIMTMGRGHRGPEDAGFVEPAVIQRHNFRARWKPFMVAPPHETFGGVWTNDQPWPWFLPAWHHWPTAQLIDSDGSITFVENGRPKSSCLTNGWGYGTINREAVVLTERSLTRFALFGMTDRAAGELAPLARSWRQPPAAATNSPGFTALGHVLAERAWHLRCAPGGPTSLTLELAASDASPVVNPAFVILDWGSAPARVRWQGAAREPGPACRLGYRNRPEGTDLVLWLEATATNPATLEVHSVAPAPSPQP